MHQIDETLRDLIAAGRQHGFLTISQINAYLPDEAVNPEKLDNLLMSIEEIGLEIVDDLKVQRPAKEPPKKSKNGKPKKEILGDDRSRRIDDPVRMYLT
ncbi:MAG: RNA polymerase sigma factor region1.1 domain-containing protein, partial [Planctomycetaceae bacterium]